MLLSITMMAASYTVTENILLTMLWNCLDGGIDRSDKD